jgi:hypothetical protein
MEVNIGKPRRLRTKGIREVYTERQKEKGLGSTTEYIGVEMK